MPIFDTIRWHQRLHQAQAADERGLNTANRGGSD